MKARSSKSKSKRGQAAAEAAIGLGFVWCLAMVVWQFGVMGEASIGALITARGEADDNAQGNLVAATNRNLLGWRVGEDLLAYTADDQPVELTQGDDLTVYTDELAAPIALTGLVAHPAIGLRDELSPLLASQSMGVSAALYLGRQTVVVPVNETVRFFQLVDADWLTVREYAAMPGLDLRSGNP